jgi:hypothetical protein
VKPRYWTHGNREATLLDTTAPGNRIREEWEVVRTVLAERMGLPVDGVRKGQGGSTEEGVVNMV